MERVVRVFTSFAEADEADLREWAALSGDERVRIGEEMTHSDRSANGTDSGSAILVDPASHPFASLLPDP